MRGPDTPLESPSETHANWSPSIEPGQIPDLQAILNEAKQLRDKGRYEEALQRHLWFHNHALEIDPNHSAVRLSFALSEWERLGRRYPKAKEALIEIRDHNTMEISEGRGFFEMFHETAAINRELQQGRRDDFPVQIDHRD